MLSIVKSACCDRKGRATKKSRSHRLYVERWTRRPVLSQRNASESDQHAAPRQDRVPVTAATRTYSVEEGSRFDGSHLCALRSQQLREGTPGARFAMIEKLVVARLAGGFGTVLSSRNRRRSRQTRCTSLFQTVDQEPVGERPQVSITGGPSVVSDEQVVDCLETNRIHRFDSLPECSHTPVTMMPDGSGSSHLNAKYR
jgi:hypothetical protein